MFADSGSIQSWSFADIARLLGRLEKRGLTDRKRDGADGRAVLNRIAGRGSSLLENLQPVLSQMAKKQFSTVSGGELEKLLSTLNKIRAASPQRLSEDNHGGY